MTMPDRPAPTRVPLPGPRQPGFGEECRRQARILQDDPHEIDTLHWLEAIADWGDVGLTPGGDSR